MLERLRRALTEDGAERRVRIATAMALVAMLGAVTTFRASQNELVASGCSRRHAAAETYFVYRKQWYADKIGENAEYVDAYKTHVSRANRFLRSASLQLPRGAPDSSFFQVEAQLEYAVARQLQPLKAFTDVELDSGLSLGAGLDKKADEDLRSIGFGGGCMIGAVHAPQLSALEALAQDTDSVRDRAIRCAAAVVFFVLGLVFFTLSEAVPARFKNACEVAGYVLSLCAVAVAILWADVALAAQYALAIAAFGVIAAIGWVGLRAFQKPATATAPASQEPTEAEVLRYEEFDTEGFRAKHVHLVIPHDRFSRAVVVLIAVAAFLSAIAGLAYSAAIADSERATMAASVHETNVVSEYSHVALDLHYIMREMNVGMEADLRESAMQMLRLGTLREYGASDIAPWSYERVQWMHAFDDFAPANVGSIHEYLEGYDGPYYDARYPYELYYRREAIAPAREVALADASDEDAAIYERGATYCLFMLTIFAIALYLFGQALAMGTSNGARILAFFAGVLIVAGVGVGLRTAAITRTANGSAASFTRPCPRPTSSPVPPATRAQVAASCYAQGEYAYEVANDREEYRPAYDRFRDTVKLRPQFALAQYNMLRAESALATPQRTGYESIEFPQYMAQMVADRKAAAAALNEREMGTPEGFVDSAAFESYIESLLTDDRRLLRSSLALARGDPELATDPTSQYNVGLMSLADGEYTAARAAYVRGLALRSKDKEADISAISDMELLRTQCPRLRWHTSASCAELAQTADGIKKQLVQNSFSPPAADPPEPQHLEIGAWVAPDGVAWAAPAAALQQVHGKLAVLWYLRDPTWHSWYVHLALMHTTAVASMERAGKTLVDYQSYLRDSNFVRCLPTRQDFRVEVYDDGQLVAEKTVPGRAGDPLFEGAQFGAADVGFCHPVVDSANARWVRRIDTHGLLDGSYTDPAGRFGLRVFDMFAPKQRSQSAGDSIALRFLYNFLFVANDFGLRPARSDCPAPANPFHTVRIRGVGGSNTLLAEGWVTPDGLLHFVFVRRTNARGTNGFAQQRAACDMLSSAQPVYPDMYPSR